VSDKKPPGDDPWALPPEVSSSSPRAPAAPQKDFAASGLESDGFDQLGTAPTPSLSAAASGPSRIASGAEHFPTPFGRYTLMRRIGVGGMAEVFGAVQDGPAGFEKTVVIKRLLPHLAEDTSAVEMFLREARVAGNLHHPNIVQIYELGEVGGRFFIAMELIEGLTLHSLARRYWAQRKSLPLELVAQAISDAAEGLHYAHTQVDGAGLPLQLVHRDVSPDNIIIDLHGRTKLLDFGIAKGANSVPVTKTGDVKGKIPYMPPELLADSEFDLRGDLWALGVSLYWLLCGRRPFVADTDLRVMQAILKQEPTRPSDINDMVPPEMDALISWLLAKKREDRPNDASEVVHALKPFLPMERASLREVVELGRNLPVPGGKIDTSGIRPAVPTTDRRAMLPVPPGSTPSASGPSPRALPTPAMTPPPVAQAEGGDDALRELEASQRIPWAAIGIGVAVVVVVILAIVLLRSPEQAPAEPVEPAKVKTSTGSAAAAQAAPPAEAAPTGETDATPPAQAPGMGGDAGSVAEPDAGADADADAGAAAGTAPGLETPAAAAPQAEAEAAAAAAGAEAEAAANAAAEAAAEAAEAEE